MCFVDDAIFICGRRIVFESAQRDVAARHVRQTTAASNGVHRDCQSKGMCAALWLRVCCALTALLLQAVLEMAFRNFSCLTVGEVIRIQYNQAVSVVVVVVMCV